MFSEASQILPTIFLGTRRDARDVEKLLEMGITHVINVGNSATFYDGSPIHTHFSPMSDYGESNLSSVVFELTSCFEDSQQQGKLLIHCHAGMNRSPSVLTGLLMHAQRMTLRDAYQLVSSKRGLCCPHESYRQELIDLEKQIHGSISFCLDDFGPSMSTIIADLTKQGG